MSHNPFSFFASFIEKELGIVYSDFNSYQLQNRLEEVSRILNLSGVDELFSKAQTNMTSLMRQVILDVATNNETSFYRDQRLFDAVKHEILPSFAGQRLRIWSAACSSGQEPYSLGMLHLEKPVATNFEIFASDIASHILKRAESGKYSQLEIQRGLTAPMMVKYFSKDDSNYWTAKPALRSLIKFKQLNLLENLDSAGEFDVIFCRNVLIYQSVPNKSKVIAKLSERLKPNGLLVMGAGESLLGISDAYDIVKSSHAVYYRLKDRKLQAA